MAAVKKPRGRHWESRETVLLLQKWGDENIQMKLLSCTRKKPIWQEISSFLRAAGYEDRDEDACKTRIHTLVSAYRSYNDECSKTGNGTPKRKPAFFDEVQELLSEKPCTKPKVVVSSSKIATGDEDREEELEVERDVENVAPNLPSCSGSASINTNNSIKCPQELEKDTETTTEDKKEKKKAGAKRPRKSTAEVFAKVDNALEAFFSYQQEADKKILEAEEARERRELEREEKRRNHDQEFLLKLAQILQK